MVDSTFLCFAARCLSAAPIRAGAHSGVPMACTWVKPAKIFFRVIPSRFPSKPVPRLTRNTVRSSPAVRETIRQADHVIERGLGAQCAAHRLPERVAVLVRVPRV